MKHALAVVVLLSLGTRSPARADSRDAWQATFGTSVTVTLAGMITWWYGVDKIDEAEEALCAGGAYGPECQPTSGTTLTAEEIERLNAKGDHGSKVSYIGAGVTAVGLTFVGISLYKGFIQKPDEKAVAVTPMISKDGAGAVLSLRW